MTENVGKCSFGHRKTEKSDHRIVAEKILFPKQGSKCKISTDLEVIWEKSFDMGRSEKLGP